DDKQNYWGRSSNWGWNAAPWWGHPSSYMFRHTFDCAGACGDMKNGTKDALPTNPADEIVCFEIAPFHQEKLPLYGGVHPTATPVIPPNTRSINAAFYDGHVKIFRQNYGDPAWDTNHDMNWVFYQTGSNNLQGKDYK